MKTATKKTAAKKIVEINLSAAVKNKLQSITVKEKQRKETIYNYPADFTEKEIGEQKGKQFRNKLRNKLRYFENNIFVAAKQQDGEKLQKLIKEFTAFYKENYRVNDFTLQSISQSQDETKTNDLATMLEIITTNMQGAPAKKTPAKKTKKVNDNNSANNE